MYSYYDQSRCFWNRVNVAWPCRHEPSSDRTVLTTAVAVFRGSGVKLPDPYSVAAAVGCYEFCRWTDSTCPCTYDSGSQGRLGELDSGAMLGYISPHTHEWIPQTSLVHFIIQNEFIEANCSSSDNTRRMRCVREKKKE